jgi:G3E family GTPase
MSKKVRFVVVGGFLGAGKTTALLRLARTLHERGERVGLITNDQAANLVDTGALQIHGFRVEEVAGACFCCKFDELAQAAERIREQDLPDVLLGEPVGSCTDLAATVVQPLQKFYGDRYHLTPYSVLVDPERARQIVMMKGFGGFSQKVAYIFLKQLEEADIICLNKVDTLSPEVREELLRTLSAQFQHARVIPTSGLTGEGYEAWLALLAQQTPAGGNIAEVDYDTYAEGEAELGWLNATVDLSARKEFEADRLTKEVVLAIAASLRARRAEVAHLKVLLHTPLGISVANFVGAHAAVTVSQPLNRSVTSGRLTVNARVHLDPIELRSVMDQALAEVQARLGVTGAVADAAWFRPGRPVPTHRFA